MNESNSSIKTFLLYALYLWIASSILLILSNAIILFGCEKNTIFRVVQNGPFSTIQITFLAVGLTWLSIGITIALLNISSFRQRYTWQTIATLSITLLYIHVCRERTDYGDVHDYILAAWNLGNGDPFPSRYIYLPFLATILEPLTRLSLRTTEYVCWLLNIFSLSLFSVLLPLILQRYRFSVKSSILLSLAFMMVNMPILRTLFYGQVNIHLANLIMLAFLLYPKFPFLSATMLALAVHLKMSPIVLILAFLWQRDWKWLLFFSIAILSIASITIVGHGHQPFVSSLENIRQISHSTEICFRDNSVDSLVRSIFVLFGYNLYYMLPTIFALKILLTLFFIWVTLLCFQRKTFQNDPPTCHAFNTLPTLLLWMMTISPLLWEYHPAFVALPYLVILSKLETPGEWLCYAFGYFLVYLVPTFDFFPWSFGRLLSPLLMLYLFYIISAREPKNFHLWVDELA